MKILLRVGIVALFVAGMGLFFFRQTAASIDVLIWTSSEKQNVLGPALERTMSGTQNGIEPAPVPVAAVMQPAGFAARSRG